MCFMFHATLTSFRSGLCTTFVLLFGCATGVADETIVPVGIPYKRLAYLHNQQVNESSGLACSRRTPGHFWTHNDSGDEPRLFAFDRDGNDQGEFAIKGAKANDWEDMASFVLDGRACLLIADVGDNLFRAGGYTLYLVEEPERLNRPGGNQQLILLQTSHFRYADGPQDCEAIAFDPTEKLCFLVAKTTKKQSNIYRLQWPLTSNSFESPVVAEKIATVNYPLVTAMDITSDGRRAVLLTYGLAYEISRKPKETWNAAFARPGRPLIMPFRRQGETICYGTNGRKLFLTSEKIPTPFFEVDTRSRH